MPPVPTHLRPPAASAKPTYQRSYATAAEADALAKLLRSAPTPFLRKPGAATPDNVRRREAIATIQGMADDAVRGAGLNNVPVSLQPAKDGDDRSFFWSGGATGQKPSNYGIVIRPDYLGAPRGLDATVRHEVAHASDMLRVHPKIPHGETFRAFENVQYVPGLGLNPVYGGNDFTGKDEYADSFSETGKPYDDHIFLSNYDDPRVRPQRVEVKDLKKAVAANRKAYVANLKNPPVPKMSLGQKQRGL